MHDSQKVTAILVATAVTGLLAGSASASSPSKSIQQKKLLIAQAGKKVKKHGTGGNACHGKNACKGQGGCFSSDKGCKGKNSCKGKGGCGTGGSGDKSKK